MRRERPEHTLEPAALVHEVFLRLVQCNTLRWSDRTHFCAIAGRVMRQVLVDHARHRGRVVRGGDLRRITLSESVAPGPEARPIDFEQVNSALCRFARFDPRAARIVELRFFSGLTMDNAASELGISLRAAANDWAHARAWLYRELFG